MKEVIVTDINGDSFMQIQENDFGQIEGVVLHGLNVIVDGKTIFKAETKRRKTNADVIREMTDEQLSEFLDDVQMGDIDFAVTFCGLCKEEESTLNCDDCRLDWLKRDCTDCRGLKYWENQSG